MERGFAKAYYIKLGRGGMWESDSIERARLRFGWSNQSVADIRSGNWKRIGEQLRQYHAGKPQVATTDLNRLQDIAGSGPDDVWITFHGAKLWWTRVTGGPVQQDAVSKYRMTEPWRDRDAKGRLLVANDLPGKIAQLQAFRGTVCDVTEADLLARVLKGERSELASEIASHREALCRSLQRAIEDLHWKDFETLVDLVFREAGWDRVSVLGQQAKAYDLELREPITGDRYVVQVKSKAGAEELRETIDAFSPDDYRRVFFVVHSPEKSLSSVRKVPAHVEVVPPALLADLALSAGLSKWLETKAW